MIPNIRQVIWAVIVGLSSHPKIQNPGIFQPIVDEGEEPEEIKIQKWRTYDGLEAQEEGLTCDVFPNNPNFEDEASLPSAEIEDRELSRGGREMMVYNLVLKLHYKGVAINNSRTVSYYVLDFPQHQDQTLPPVTPHGFNFLMDDPELDLRNGASTLKAFNEKVSQKFPNQIKQAKKRELEIEVNPPEEVLREYLELLRICLNDIDRLLPFRIRGSRVTSLSFPTTSWSGSNPDVYFHTAYLNWRFISYPPSAQEIRMMNAIPTDTLKFSPTPEI